MALQKLRLAAALLLAMLVASVVAGCVVAPAGSDYDYESRHHRSQQWRDDRDDRERPIDRRDEDRRYDREDRRY